MFEYDRDGAAGCTFCCHEDDDHDKVLFKSSICCVYPTYEGEREASSLGDLYVEHSRILNDASFSQTSTPKRAWCHGRVTREFALFGVRDAARASGALLIVLCGRERDGDLLMSDGTTLGWADVTAALREARFTGRVLCAVNLCRATRPSEGASDGASEATRASDHTWGRWGAWGGSPDQPPLVSPFQWLILHSCDWDERDGPSHAHHVTRLAARLTLLQDWQDHERVEGLWRATRCGGEGGGRVYALTMASPQGREVVSA
jgi:hypothetical protein